MVIENRDAVVAGTKLVATYKKQQYVCSVGAGKDGKLAFTFDGKNYSSPSSAGTAIIGTACNGWRFWSLADGAPASKETAKPKPKSQAASMPKTAKRLRQQEMAKQTILRRHDNQDDLSAGETRWVCNACLKLFTVFGNETPEACPEGHRNDDPDLSPMATSADAEGGKDGTY